MLVEIAEVKKVVNLLHVESIEELLSSQLPYEGGKDCLLIHMSSGHTVELDGWTLSKWNHFMSRVMTQMNLTQGGRMS